MLSDEEPVLDQMTRDYDFTLPAELIAQEPLEQREEARMMLVDRSDSSIRHYRVGDLPHFLHSGDCLVLNDTKVIPARIFGTKERTGGKVELLLLEPYGSGSDTWEALCGSARRPKPGTYLDLAEGRLRAEILAWREGGGVIVRFQGDAPLLDVLEKEGLPPLPPYIKRPDKPPAPTLERDRRYYQTVYARLPGAVAAPTAGLHLTEDLLTALASQGVREARLTLHVGMGTFKPVKTERVAEHRMEAERYIVSTEAARAIHEARSAGGRIVAVGSTSVRTLETVADQEGVVHPSEGRTAIFIHPPYRFRAVDAVLTNFHLPKSTLIMMMSAFAGTDLIRNAYAEAIRMGYRFYSYGDCMLIV